MRIWLYISNIQSSVMFLQTRKYQILTSTFIVYECWDLLHNEKFEQAHLEIIDVLIKYK
jgi:hypothetical protein